MKVRVQRADGTDGRLALTGKSFPSVSGMMRVFQTLGLPAGRNDTSHRNVVDANDFIQYMRGLKGKDRKKV